MAITMTITGETPLEIFSTIKGCAALLAPNIPEAKPGDRPGQAKTPAQAVQTAQAAPSAYIPVAKAAPSQPQAAAAAPVTAAAFTNGTARTPPPPPIPTAQAPGYTLEQLARAGADLITARPELMPQLQAMVAKYGVKTLKEIRPEQYGAVATELRALGANI